MAGLGEPLDFTDEELEDLAEVSDQDLLDIYQYVVKVLSPRFKNLPLTEPEIDNADFAEIG